MSDKKELTPLQEIYSVFDSYPLTEEGGLFYNGLQKTRVYYLKKKSRLLSDHMTQG